MKATASSTTTGAEGEATSSSSVKDLPPHCFQVASNAFEQMMENQLDQAIVIWENPGLGKRKRPSLS